MADRLSKLLTENLVNFDSQTFLANLQGLNLRHSSISKNVFEHSSTWCFEDEIKGVLTDWILHFLLQRDFSEQLATAIKQEVFEKIFHDPIVLKDSLITVENGKKYSSDKLESVVLAKLKEVGEEWLNRINKGKEAYNEKHFSSLPLLQVSTYAIKNTRRKMEDKHVCLQTFSSLYHLKKEYKYFAVFDGHGGVEAAKYSSIHLHNHLATQLASLPTCQSKISSLGSSVDGNVEENDVARALKEAFKLTDEAFSRRNDIERNNSGCTALCLLLEKNYMHVAWLGDSMALLVRNGKPVSIMQPHKPEREDEKQRIIGLGGTVDYVGTWRVNGTMGVSRAIGDCSLKPWLCSDADTTTLLPHPDDQYMVLACDGLWDVLSMDDVVKGVAEHLVDNDRASTASHLVKMAKDKGSKDNITVLVVFLDRGGGANRNVKDGDVIKIDCGDVAGNCSNKNNNSNTSNNNNNVNNNKDKNSDKNVTNNNRSKTNNVSDNHKDVTHVMKADHIKYGDSDESCDPSDVSNDSKKNYLRGSESSRSASTKSVKSRKNSKQHCKLSIENKENISILHSSSSFSHSSNHKEPLTEVGARSESQKINKNNKIEKNNEIKNNKNLTDNLAPLVSLQKTREKPPKKLSKSFSRQSTTSSQQHQPFQVSNQSIKSIGDLGRCKGVFDKGNAGKWTIAVELCDDADFKEVFMV